MFHFHKWSDWNITERGKVADQWNRDRVWGTYFIQERYCHKCSKTQIELKKTTMRQDIDLIPTVKPSVLKKDGVV